MGALATAGANAGTHRDIAEMTALARKALQDYDSKKRRNDNNAVIKKSRKYGNWALSSNRFVNACMRLSFKMISPSMMIAEMTSGDRSNKTFMEKLEKDLKKMKSRNPIEMHV